MTMIHGIVEVNLLTGIHLFVDNIAIAIVTVMVMSMVIVLVMMVMVWQG